jgi:hypothetical protein
MHFNFMVIRKVIGSINVEDTGVFGWPNSSSGIMVLGLTQSLTEVEYQEYSWG